MKISEIEIPEGKKIAFINKDDKAFTFEDMGALIGVLVVVAVIIGFIVFVIPLIFPTHKQIVPVEQDEAQYYPVDSGQSLNEDLLQAKVLKLACEQKNGAYFNPTATSNSIGFVISTGSIFTTGEATCTVAGKKFTNDGSDLDWTYTQTL